MKNKNLKHSDKLNKSDVYLIYLNYEVLFFNLDVINLKAMF